LEEKQSPSNESQKNPRYSDYIGYIDHLDV
jgi:hypothetical protein